MTAANSFNSPRGTSTQILVFLQHVFVYKVQDRQTNRRTDRQDV